MKFVIIIISMVLVNNYPLAQFLGICPFLGVSKDLDSHGRSSSCSINSASDICRRLYSSLLSRRWSSWSRCS